MPRDELPLLPPFVKGMTAGTGASEGNEACVRERRPRMRDCFILGLGGVFVVSGRRLGVRMQI